MFQTCRKFRQIFLVTERSERHIKCPFRRNISLC